MTSQPTVPARIPRQEVGLASTGLVATGAMAIGALAVGAVALGVLAVGRLAIGELALRSGFAKRLKVDDLIIARLRVIEILSGESEIKRPVEQEGSRRLRSLRSSR